MKLVDVHAHLDFDEFSKDIEEVISRAEGVGMKAVICQGVHHESNLQVLKLAERFSVCKAALGVYPLNAKNVVVDGEYDDFDRSSALGFDETLAFIESKKDVIVAIGEVGIDLKFSSDVDNQVENFVKVIELSKRIGKPMIVHSRKAEELVLDLLEKQGVKDVLLHCFSGKKRFIERGVKMGCMFSVPANVVRNDQFQMNVGLIPITQLMTETDAPFLSPVAGRRCEPADVLGAVKKIASLKGMDVSEVGNSIFMNYQRLFG
tara:strand:- start:182 stop:967 length:786 start_codon:yes stop_codon:yes gene_type:complete